MMARNVEGGEVRGDRPLDGEALERLALHYVGRYATTQAKLRSYLARKLRERGWSGEGEPPVQSLVQRLAVARYVDDAAFAEAKASSLSRRGYGVRRVAQALTAAGVGAEEAQPALEEAGEKALEAALRFARRRGIGPFADAPPDRARRDKWFAAMIRAGHPGSIARIVVNSLPGEIPEQDSCQKS